MPTSSAPASGLADRVARDLRERILTGELTSGLPLRETTLSREHAASRNTVREAFRLLARERLVEHEAHKGVAVRRLSVADVDDIYLVRLALEPAGMADVDPEELAAVVAEARQASEREDWRGVSTADLRFHQVVVSGLGSARFDEMFHAVLAELRLAFAQVVDGRRFHEPYLQRNAHLVGLLRAGEVEEATRELIDYLETSREQVRLVVSLRGAP